MALLAAAVPAAAAAMWPEDETAQAAAPARSFDIFDMFDLSPEQFAHALTATGGGHEE